MNRVMLVRLKVHVESVESALSVFICLQINSTHAAAQTVNWRQTWRPGESVKSARS